jgi:hypothetical protein
VTKGSTGEAMKVETKTKRYIVCPRCGNDSKRVCHLEPGCSFGPWRCDGDCPMEFSGRIEADGSVTVDAREGEARRRGLALLRFRDLFLVVEERYGRIEEPDFFYHSHQCPTNQLRHVEKLFDADGDDPHGVLRFVASIDATEETEAALEAATSLRELLVLFKTDGQPAPSEWPEKNRGMLDFVAEAQRDHAKQGDA